MVDWFGGLCSHKRYLATTTVMITALTEKSTPMTPVYSLMLYKCCHMHANRRIPLKTRMLYKGHSSRAPLHHRIAGYVGSQLALYGTAGGCTRILDTQSASEHCPACSGPNLSPSVPRHASDFLCDIFWHTPCHRSQYLVSLPWHAPVHNDE